MARKHSFKLIQKMIWCFPFFTTTPNSICMDKKNQLKQTNSSFTPQLNKKNTNKNDEGWYFQQHIPSKEILECFNAIANNDPERLSKAVSFFDPNTIYAGTNKTLFQAQYDLMKKISITGSLRHNSEITNAERILSILLITAARFENKK